MLGRQPANCVATSSRIASLAPGSPRQEAPSCGCPSGRSPSLTAPMRTPLLEAADAQADQLAHAPDLPLSPLAEHEAQLIVVQPFDLGRLQLALVEAEAVIQQRQALGVKLAFDANQILLVDRESPDRSAGAPRAHPGSAPAGRSNRCRGGRPAPAPSGMKDEIPACPACSS
jgi:hypothetical protein